MPAIYFQLSSQQSHEVQTFMKEEGYSSKAEFFRFLLKMFKYTKKSPGRIRLEQAVASLKETLIKLDKEGKLKKLERPLSELLDEDELEDKQHVHRSIHKTL